MPQIHSEKIKKAVKAERVKGKTYRELTYEFGIPKSTLSYWFGETLGHPFDRAGQIKHLARIRPLAHAAIQKRIQDKHKILQTKLVKEIKQYPTENVGTLKLFLAALYWAEGVKNERTSGAIFVNTDRNLCKLYITLLRKCYNIDESRFRIRLHLHYYHGIKETRRFWSKLLEVPENKFGKIYIKKRSVTKRFRRNFGGICFIRYTDSDLRRELLEISKQFCELIISKENMPSSFNG